MVLAPNRQAAQCATDDGIRFVLTNADSTAHPVAAVWPFITVAMPTSPEEADGSFSECPTSPSVQTGTLPRTLTYLRSLKV